MRFLGAGNEWQERWPPAAGEAEALLALPVAVEVQLELDELGTLTWLFRLPQEFVPGAQPNLANTPGEERGNEEQNDAGDEEQDQSEDEGQDQAEDEG